MSETNITQCVLFPDLFCKPLVARFDQEHGSSDGGAVLLKAADQRLDLTRHLAECLPDEREPGKVSHELLAGSAMEQVYCRRGDIENRVKELQEGLQIDRTSCSRFWPTSSGCS